MQEIRSFDTSFTYLIIATGMKPKTVISIPKGQASLICASGQAPHAGTFWLSAGTLLWQFLKLYKTTEVYLIHEVYFPFDIFNCAKNNAVVEVRQSRSKNAVLTVWLQY